MFRSMTGYGQAEVKGVRNRIAVEIRSLNSRYMDLNLRLPTGGWALEPKIRKGIGNRLRRGRIDVQVKWEPLNPEEEPPVELHLGRAKAYLKALERLRDALGIAGMVDLGLMASFQDLISSRDPSIEAEEEAVQRAVGLALDSLQEMKIAEGKAIQRDMEERLASMEQELEGLGTLAKRVVEGHLSRWRERLQLLMGEQRLDQGRLEQEMAIWVDKLDVTEELVRLKSHLQQFRSLMVEEDPVGRRLEFLLQEMHREANTLGVRANDAEVSQRIAGFKAQIERLREQVQNVE
ncbi:MAG: YicC/YloC family endoribonuclease [Thermodesulfobacteriota bacterium]